MRDNEPLTKDVRASMREADEELTGELFPGAKELRRRLQAIEASDLSADAKAAGRMLVLNNAVLGRVGHGKRSY
jgi:hypothetical protein